MKIFYLYKIVNTINEKVYIGVTSRPKERMKEHLYKSSTCTKLVKAMNKHGRENFSMVLLCAGSEEYILDLEIKAIESYNSLGKSGYNSVLGHPNKNGASMCEEMRSNVSKGLTLYYQNNVCKNLGAERLSKRDNSPYFISGFWFPNKRVGMSAINMNQKSFYKRRADGTLGDVCHPQKKSISHSPVYVMGLWFPDLITAAAVLNKEMSFLQTLLRKGDVEEILKRVNTKLRTKSPDEPIGVNLRSTGSWRAVVWCQKQRVYDKTFKTKEEAVLAYDDNYEKFHGRRPNGTLKVK